MCLNTWPLAGAAVYEGGGTFKRWILNGGSESLGPCGFLRASCFCCSVFPVQHDDGLHPVEIVNKVNLP